MKTDARILHTRHALRTALLELLRDKPVDDITVKEVCEKASVSRATFYKHYKDCYDLLHQMEQIMLEKYLRALNITNPVDVNQLADAVFDMIAENAELFRLVYNCKHNEQRIQQLIALAKEPTVNLWKQMLNNISDTEVQLLFSFIANGLVNTISTHLDDMNREEMLPVIRGMMHRCLSPYL